jgi:hypothetical protein
VKNILEELLKIQDDTILEKNLEVLSLEQLGELFDLSIEHKAKTYREHLNNQKLADKIFEISYLKSLNHNKEQNAR